MSLVPLLMVIIVVATLLVVVAVVVVWKLVGDVNVGAGAGAAGAVGRPVVVTLGTDVRVRTVSHNCCTLGRCTSGCPHSKLQLLHCILVNIVVLMVVVAALMCIVCCVCVYVRVCA